MDSEHLLTYGLIAAALLALWFLFKVVKKVLLVVLIIVAVAGIALGLYFKYF